MDFISAFKSELFRPLATLVVPGGVALGPYVLVAGYYFPDVISFWREHPSAFVAIVVISIVAVGLIVEDLGAFIERDFWDSKLAKRTKITYRSATVMSQTRTLIIEAVAQSYPDLAGKNQNGREDNEVE
jgi:hypothetical protein